MTAEDRYHQFAKDPGRRDRLAALLADPVFVEAQSIIEDLMAPRINTQADAVPALAAAYHHQVAGANHFVRKLRDLSREPVERRPLKVKALVKSNKDLPKQ